MRHKPTTICDGNCSRPGKFEGNECGELASRLWEASLDGADEECGESGTTGWYGLLVGLDTNDDPALPRFAIVSEDSQGFVSYETFPTEEEARETFDAIAADCNGDEE